MKSRCNKFGIRKSPLKHRRSFGLKTKGIILISRQPRCFLSKTFLMFVKDIRRGHWICPGVEWTYVVSTISAEMRYSVPGLGFLLKQQILCSIVLDVGRDFFGGLIINSSLSGVIFETLSSINLLPLNFYSPMHNHFHNAS